jgi:hypothetical protein
MHPTREPDATSERPIIRPTAMGRSAWREPTEDETERVRRSPALPTAQVPYATPRPLSDGLARGILRG